MIRIVLSIAIVLLAALLGAAVWYFGSPLILDRTVDEALPFALPLPLTGVEATPSAEETPVDFPSEDEIGVIMPPTLTVTVEVTAEATATVEVVTATVEAPVEAITAEPTREITAVVVDETPANVPVVLGQGQFVDGDSFHKGSGVATLYEGPNGDYLLRFDDFAATNGPDLHVVLSTNPAPTDHTSLGDFLDLGSLKGNIGDQNYEIPTGIDVRQYKSVIIYCLPFQVIFATATLE
jgi:hypothetical protein